MHLKVNIYERDNGELNAIVHTGTGMFVCVTRIPKDSQKDDISSIVRPTTVGGLIRKNPGMLPESAVTKDYEIGDEYWREMAAAALDICRNGVWIATLSPRKTELFLDKMGSNGRRFFGISE